MFDAREIAYYFVKLAGDNNINDMTPLKSLKLIYITHGWTLGIKNRSLIDNRIEAWQYGPVIPDLYHHVGQRYKGKNIIIEEKYNKKIDEETLSFINKVFDKYGRFSANQLIAMTHADGTPWHYIWHKHGNRSEIPNKLIQEYYTNLANG